MDPAKRLSAPAALAHPWLATDGEAAPARKAPVGARAFTALERYARATFFHKRVFHALADTLTLAELAALRKEFAYLDVDGDGFVTVEDLTKVLAALESEGRHASGTALEVEAVVEACDVARDHRISYHEFCVASMHRGAYLREDRVDRLFHEYLDTNRHDAHLVTVQSLKAHGFDDASVADVFAAAKATPGKGISRSAFAKLLRLGAIHGASTRGESHKARSLLGHSLDLTGDSPELGVHLKAVFDHVPVCVCDGVCRAAAGRPEHLGDGCPRPVRRGRVCEVCVWVCVCPSPCAVCVCVCVCVYVRVRAECVCDLHAIVCVPAR